MGRGGERQVTDIGKYGINAKLMQPRGFRGDASRKISVGGPVGGSRSGAIDGQCVDHHIAEVAGGGDVREGRLNALSQFRERQAATQGEA